MMQLPAIGPAQRHLAGVLGKHLPAGPDLGVSPEIAADLIEVVTKVPILFLFCLVMAVTNLVFTLIAGKLLRLNLEELLLSVNATLGGAPSAAAMAISRGWSNLVLPGLLAGIWGYVIGTFLGIVVTEALLKLQGP